MEHKGPVIKTGALGPGGPEPKCNPSICPSIYLSMYLSIYVSVCLCMSVCLCICLSVSVSVCLVPKPSSELNPKQIHILTTFISEIRFNITHQCLPCLAAQRSLLKDISTKILHTILVLLTNPYFQPITICVMLQS